mgnify:CR=1 FL=1
MIMPQTCCGKRYVVSCAVAFCRLGVFIKKMADGIILCVKAGGEKFLDLLLKTVVLPAYTALGDGLILLEDESIPLTGLGAAPRGKEYYEALIIAETGSCP